MNAYVKEDNLNGTIKSKILLNPVRFIIKKDLKPKSKDSVIRFGKLKIPKKTHENNSEAVSPTKESDLFGMTFS